ncbi:hypothetical protein CXB51_030683 [Gossypium anomalum]|uniref:Uncharacterized protein n=1 Tax=Gossypium anomalum TaxID=47600 RepID=A0A8J6CNM5_9ROSI|nr:hypothetical protein CXB51_030683 [Gossypium anomalum]
MGSAEMRQNVWPYGEDDPGDVGAEHGDLSCEADLLVLFWLIPEVSGILRLLRFFLDPVGLRVWVICKLG